MSGIGALQQRLRNFLVARKERRRLDRVARLGCEAGRLSCHVNAATLREMLHARQTDDEWPVVEREIAALSIGGDHGGVNPGDRRAIYYLTRALRPASVLEIGTHIGASTVHFVAALRRSLEPGAAPSCRLTTVDIADVNDRAAERWRRYGSTSAPAEMIHALGASAWVRFVTARSLDYLAACPDRYDFIFLDGDHAAATVYQEIPAALRVLNPGGVLLLHDCFPRLGSLWSNGKVIPGPWLATERLRAERAPIRVLPLGELPWPTKLGSRVTSLALVVGAEAPAMAPG